MLLGWASAICFDGYDLQIMIGVGNPGPEVYLCQQKLGAVQTGHPLDFTSECEQTCYVSGTNHV